MVSGRWRAEGKGRERERGGFGRELRSYFGKQGEGREEGRVCSVLLGSRGISSESQQHGCSLSEEPLHSTPLPTHTKKKGSPVQTRLYTLEKNGKGWPSEMQTTGTLPRGGGRKTEINCDKEGTRVWPSVERTLHPLGCAGGERPTTPSSSATVFIAREQSQ